MYDDLDVLIGKNEITMLIQTKDEIIINNNYYVYSGGSFDILLYSERYFILYNDYSEIELQLHCQIGYRNQFKVYTNKIAIYIDDIEYIYTKNIPFSVNLEFYKLSLHQFYYYQDNDEISIDLNDNMFGINTNYFKNDLYGYRTIACIDLEQKFTEFYDFGYFIDIIEVNEIPDVPDIPDEPVYSGLVWYVSGFNIQTGNTVIITSTHFNNTFQQIELINIQIPFPVYQNQYSYGAWYDVVWNAIVWFVNILIIIGAGILYALFTALEYTIIILFFTIIVLLWNLGFGGIVWIYLQILEGLFYFLPWLIEWISETLLPVILDGIAVFIGFVGGYILWLLSGTLLSLPDIQSALTVITDNIFTVFYDIGLVVLRNLVNIVNFMSIYLIIYYLMYFKLFLAKSRGFVNAVAQITLVMSIWSYPVKLLAKISKTLSDLVPKIFPI